MMTNTKDQKDSPSVSFFFSVSNNEGHIIPFQVFSDYKGHFFGFQANLQVSYEDKF